MSKDEELDSARSGTVDFVYAFFFNQLTAVKKLKSYDSSKGMDYDGFVCGYIYGASDGAFQVFDKSEGRNENWHFGAFEIFLKIFSSDGSGLAERAAEDAADILFNSEKYMTSSSGNELWDTQFQLGVERGGKEIKHYIKSDINDELPEDKQELFSKMYLASWLFKKNKDVADE